MTIETREIRCTACGSLLAKLADGALTIQRNDLQVAFDGDFRMSIICYRAKCRRLNVLRFRVCGGSDGSMRSPP